MTIDSDSAKFSGALRSAILLPVGAIFLTALVLLLFIFRLLQTVELSDHSFEVLAHTKASEIDMIDMETGLRGYLLSGDSSFLEPYNAAIKRVDGDFLTVKELVRDNPEQTIRIDDLIGSKNSWLEYAQSCIKQRQQGTILNTDANGKSVMDDIRAKFDRFSEAELDLRNQRLDQLRHTKRALASAGGGLLAVLFLSVSYFVYRQFMALAGEYRGALTTIEQRHAALLRSEADLEAQKEWFRVTLSSIGDGVIVTDPEGRVVFMNHEAEELSGWKSVEALLKPLPEVFKIVNEETRVRVEDPVAKVFREKKVVGLANHTVLLSKVGPEWPIEDSAAPIYDSRGKTIGVVLVFHNATDLRRAQNAMRAYSEDLERKVAERTTQLQQSVVELEAFSYAVSHDLRSPLRAMQGFSEAVLEDYGTKIDPTGQDYLNRIKKASERLDRLIQDLLSYTRISRQNEPLSAQDLDRIVREVIEHNAEFNPPAATIEVQGTLLPVLGREATLTQIVSNLLGNAVKFVAPGVHPLVRVWTEDKGARVRLWVADNGIGIAPADQQRIFEMFVQAHGPSVFGGSGVGLAIIKKAVQNLQGDTGVESAEGRGSRFWVELNRAGA